MKEIIYAGGSHYGLFGYKSICEFFDRVYLVKENSLDILNEKRECDVIIDNFLSVDCQIVFLCGYIRLISEDELNRKTFVNIHGALLPKYRGMHSTFYAIMNGEKKLGITFHLVNKYMDAGNILSQYSFNYKDQNVQEINDTIDKLVGEYAGNVLNDFCLGKLKPAPQNEDEATYGAKRNLEDCLVDFSMSNVLLKRFFKALTPNYPYPMLEIRGEKYEILPDTLIIDRQYYGPVGRAVFVDEKGVWIKTEEGFLVVKKIRKYEDGEEQFLEDMIPIGYRFSKLT